MQLSICNPNLILRKYAHAVKRKLMHLICEKGYFQTMSTQGYDLNFIKIKTCVPLSILNRYIQLQQTLRVCFDYIHNNFYSLLVNDKPHKRDTSFLN